MNGFAALHRWAHRRTLRGAALCLLSLPMAFSASADCGGCAAIVRPYVANEGFNGVVLVGHGAHIDYSASYGVADATTGRALTADTPFESGSISKWIAAMAVLRLVQQGELALDEPVSTYLPDYRLDNGAKLTLRVLLSHASGLPNAIDEAIKRDPATRNVSMDQAEAVRRFASGDLRFEPGTEWDYSHSNWVLVKSIVERATGRDYASLVDGYIVQPLAMRHSGTFSGSSLAVPGMAHGYVRLRPVAEPLDKPSPNFMMLAGGFYASANDLFALVDGLFSGKVLSPEITRIFMTVERPAQHYALGGRTKTLSFGGKDHPVAWEYGSAGAYRVLVWRTLDDGHTVVLMNNTSFDHMRMGDLATALMEASYR